MSDKRIARKKPNGYVLHEDNQRVIIGTGFARKTSNRKTGNMIQIWVLVKNVNPLTAVKTGKDSAICGDCPARGSFCYVEIGRAPMQIWNAWKRGNYPTIPTFELFRGRLARFGAYGDPAFVPFGIIRTIAETADGFTGYTHQWRNPLFAAYRQFVMASVETQQGYELATSLGWRTFRVMPKDCLGSRSA